MNQTVSFTDILKNQKVIIPIIQRDYAQGRIDKKVTDVRSHFLQAIFGTIESRITKENDAVLELDFIYGFCREEEQIVTFSPIDGQQRLTTLWLLYWYVSHIENVEEAKTEFLKNFTYQTRHSTNVFINKLIQYKLSHKNLDIDEDIKDQPWYFNDWNHDPGIQAMLIMLKDIEQHYKALQSQQVWQKLNNTPSPFKFHCLEMGEIGLPDDLYIKMNSRGKPLTEFEYFKATFLEIIKDDALRIRFENSIDGKWYECLWSIILNANADNDNDVDLADICDGSFLRFINYFTNLLASISELPFIEINYSIKESAAIYQKKENLHFLFDALDALATQHEQYPDFWKQTFYYNQEDFNTEKVRLYFPHNNENLFERCLLHYKRNERIFTLSEQVLLYACILQLLFRKDNFNTKIRKLRNLVVNSDNELRLDTIKVALGEVRNYLLGGNLSNFSYFKTDQISEEKEKNTFIENTSEVEAIVYQLEDSKLLRGCISIFDFDELLKDRALQYLQLFDENAEDWHLKSNLLLCFGDYSQDDDSYITNLLSKNPGNWRHFFTAGYNKEQLISKTKPVLMNCIDFFNNNPQFTADRKYSETLAGYQHTVKGWDYYFLKYPRFRWNCNQGYYYWESDNEYVFVKRKERQRNSYSWDPFLEEIKEQVNHIAVELNYYGGELELTIGTDLLSIISQPYGYLITNKNEAQNRVMELLKNQQLITENGENLVRQQDNKDLDDRIVQGVELVKEILKFA